MTKFKPSDYQEALEYLQMKSNKAPVDTDKIVYSALRLAAAVAEIDDVMVEKALEWLDESSDDSKYQIFIGSECELVDDPAVETIRQLLTAVLK